MDTPGERQVTVPMAGLQVSFVQNPIIHTIFCSRPEEGSGNNILSARELEVLLLTAKEMSSQIASHLRFWKATVEDHVANTYAGGASSRADAVKKKSLTGGLKTFRDLSGRDQWPPFLASSFRE